MANVQIDQDAANIPGVNFVEQSGDLAAPGSGHAKLYIKSGVLYVRLHTGDPIAVGGVVALDENSLAVGAAGDTLSSLTPGAEGAVPTRQADGTIAEVVPAAPGGGGLTLIEEIVVTPSAVASVTFSNIPATYKHLCVHLSARTAWASAFDDVLALRFNADSGAHYDHTNPYYAASGETSAWLGYIAGDSLGADNWGIAEVWIPYYLQDDRYHTIHSHFSIMISGNQTGYVNHISANLWNQKTAITSITLYSRQSANLKVGSRFCLYGY